LRSLSTRVWRPKRPVDPRSSTCAEVERTKEECRDARRVSWIQDLISDLRYGLRMLGKSVGFASAAVLVLALGICASISILAFVDAALIKPLPYRNPNRLVGVFETNGMFLRSNLSYLDYFGLEEAQQCL
jgi:macrolide transport system ATP-binding/permease protein